MASRFSSYRPKSKYSQRLVETELTAAGFTTSGDNIVKVAAALELKYPEHQGELAFIRETIAMGAADLEKAPPPPRPVFKPITPAEAEKLYRAVLSANAHWVADTQHNGAMMAHIFTTDPACVNSDLEAMRTALRICRDKGLLERVTPPQPPPKPVYDEGPLQPHQLPLDTPVWKQRSSSVTAEQQRDLVNRIRKYEIWRQANPDAD